MVALSWKQKVRRTSFVMCAGEKKVAQKRNAGSKGEVNKKGSKKFVEIGSKVS